MIFHQIYALCFKYFIFNIILRQTLERMTKILYECLRTKFWDMEKYAYSTTERAKCAAWQECCNSVVKVQPRFQAQYIKNRKNPDGRIIRRWRDLLVTTGSVQNAKRTWSFKKSQWRCARCSRILRTYSPTGTHREWSAPCWSAMTAIVSAFLIQWYDFWYIHFWWNLGFSTELLNRING